MEVIGDVEWQLGNFTLLEICQIILDAFTLGLLLSPLRNNSTFPSVIAICGHWWLAVYPPRCQCRRVRVTVLVVSHGADDRSCPTTPAELADLRRLDQGTLSGHEAVCEFDRNGHSQLCC